MLEHRTGSFACGNLYFLIRFRLSSTLNSTTLNKTGTYHVDCHCGLENAEQLSLKA